MTIGWVLNGPMEPWSFDFTVLDLMAEKQRKREYRAIQRGAIVVLFISLS